MVVELTVISLLPPNETGRSAAKYIPMRVYYRKMFETHNISVEECIDPKGWNNKKCSVVKHENEYYKVKHTYDELKKYISPLVITGLHAKRSNNSNI